MAKKVKFDYDLIVIGSGAGGSAAASIAARSGKQVAIVESDTFGGDSPNFSDVPLDALSHVAGVISHVRNSSHQGVRGNALSYNYPSVRAWKELVVSRTGAGGNRRYYDNLGVTTYAGRAHFLSPNEITVNRRHLSAKNFLIATGSFWQAPKIQGLDAVGYFTPRTILQSLKPPKSILIIGGGEIGVEIGELLASFGSKVYVAEKQTRLLPSFEPEVGEVMTKYLTEQKSMTILAATEILAVHKEGLSKKVLLKRGGEEKLLKVDEVLVACGRTPALDLGLDNASVEYTAKGMSVDKYLQTSNKHIYAAGDVLGRKFNQAHSAILESRVAVNNIFSKEKIEPDYKGTPKTVNTYPAVASVGLTAGEYLNRKIAIKSAVCPLNIIAKSNTSDFSDGFVKLVTNKKGEILGGTVVSPAASEIIHEISLASRHKLTADDLANTPHAFLSWSEALKVAAFKLT